ncbi:hypothetical protein [Nocardiopsis sp. FIRDI 009]|uniref:hypothetical protein n=1 Tax=Nocardiopsis sp. FIRDI 009 TaxID=714197 RepID=UPI0013002C7D|nr:hypothetical protein [Nocardiopsis sp. FIRDI 009]
MRKIVVAFGFSFGLAFAAASVFSAADEPAVEIAAGGTDWPNAELTVTDGGTDW